MTEWIVTSAVLTALAIAAWYALRGKISLRLQYGLWLVVLVRLLIPVSFGGTTVSVANVAAPTQPLGRISQTVVTYVGGEVPDLAILEPDPSLPEVVREAQYKENEAAWQREIDAYRAATGTPVSVGDVLLGLWIGGGVVLAGILLLSNVRFARALRRSRRRLAVDGVKLPVYETAAVDTPCLYGLFRPAIYVTPAVQDGTTLAYVLAHEETHYHHGDHIWSALRCLCLVLHWYNPLVWWAAMLSRRDGELACDEATVSRLGEAQRAAYGRALVDLSCRKPQQLLVTATTMTGSARSIQERIRLLVKKPKTTLGIALVVAALIAAAVGCTFTGAAAAPETPADPVEDVALPDAAEPDPVEPDGEAPDAEEPPEPAETVAQAPDTPWAWAQSVTAEQLGGDSNAAWLARILNNLEEADFMPVTGNVSGVYGWSVFWEGQEYPLSLTETGRTYLKYDGIPWWVSSQALCSFLRVQSGDGDGSGEVLLPQELSWIRAEELTQDAKEDLIAQLTAQEDFQSSLPAGELCFGDGWLDARGWAHVQFRVEGFTPATILEAAAEEIGDGVWELRSIGDAPGQELWTGTPQGQKMSDEELVAWGDWLVAPPTEPEGIRMQFLTSYYRTPEDIDLYQLFYNGCADGGYTSGQWTQPSQAEAEEVLGGPVALDCSKTTTAEMEWCLQTYLGIGLADTWGYNLNLFTYSEKYDAYYNVHGDTNSNAGLLQSGWNMPDGSVRLWYVRSGSVPGGLVDEVALAPDGQGGWHFLYNLPMSGGGIP